MGRTRRGWGCGMKWHQLTSFLWAFGVPICSISLLTQPRFPVPCPLDTLDTLWGGGLGIG